MSFRGVTISYSPESPENIMHAIYNMYFYVVILCPMYAIFICTPGPGFFKKMQNGTPKISGYRLIKTLRSVMLEISHFQSVNGSGQNSPFP